MPATNLWTREEMILVLGLYLRLPFGKFHHSNPEVIKMANLIGRTPSSVAMRLSNYAALDPMLHFRQEVSLDYKGAQRSVAVTGNNSQKIKKV